MANRPNMPLLNRSKRSLGLNLKTGRRRCSSVQQLVATGYDIVLEQFRPGDVGPPGGRL